jgi:hypothetical protein
MQSTPNIVRFSRLNATVSWNRISRSICNYFYSASFTFRLGQLGMPTRPQIEFRHFVIRHFGLWTKEPSRCRSSLVHQSCFAY